MEHVASRLTSGPVEAAAADALAALPSGLLLEPAAFHPDSPFLRQVPFLFWLVETLRPSSIVEVGVTDGVTYMAACQAVERLGLDASCRGAGAWAGGDVPADLRSHEAGRYAGISRLEAGDGERLLAALPERSVDLLVIGPAAEPSAEDVVSWLDRLSSRGVVLLTATGPDGSPERRLHETFAAGRATIELQLAPGAAAVLVGPAVPDLLVEAAGLRFGTRAHAALNQLFARLGLAQTADAAVAARDLSARLAEERLAQAEAARQEAEGQAAELDELRRAYESRTSRTALIEAELFTQGSRLQALTEERDRLAREAEDWGGPAAIEALRLQLGAQQDELDRLATEMSVRFEELAALTRHAEQIDAKLLATEALLHAKEAALADREKDLRVERRRMRDLEAKLAEATEASRHVKAEASRASALAREEARRLERRIADLEASTSWRLTRPLRVLARAVRR